MEALQNYDIAGVVGAVNPELAQPSWGLAFDVMLRAKGWQPGLEASGAVGHGDYRHPELSVYGPTPRACRFLDGLLLMVRVGSLRDAQVRFDERFAFHLYGIDFCRMAVAAGLRLGTWPITVTHRSHGNYDSGAWRKGAAEYLGKWDDEQ